MKIMLVVKMKLAAVTNPIRMNIDSPTSLYAFRRQLDVKMALAEVHSIEAIKMTVETKTIFALAKPKKARKGKHATNEKKLRDLSTILYGDASLGKQQQEAEWDEECDYFMATNNARAERSETFS